MTPKRHTVSRLIGAPPGYVGYDEGSQLTEAVRRRPYSVALFDEIILFRSLTKDDLLQIVDIQMRHLRHLLAQRQIGLELTDATRQYLANVGEYDPVYGARSLKRVIQREVQDPLALVLLQGEFTEGATVQVDALDGRIVFQRAAVESVID